MSEIKTFFLDTNVLLHDPASIYKFQDNMVVIAPTVIEELDGLKVSSKDVAADARTVIRHLEAIVGDKSSHDITVAGVQRNTEGGQLLIPSLPIYNADDRALGQIVLSDERRVMMDLSPDQKIIYQALLYRDRARNEGDKDRFISEDHAVIFVSKDLNARIMAKSMGIDAQDYKAARIIDPGDEIRTGIDHFDINEFDFEHSREGEASVLTGSYRKISDYLKKDLYINSFLIDEEKGGIYEVSAIDIENDRITLQSLRSKNGALEAFGVSPQNERQRGALSLLLNDDIPAVVVTGNAGSGKTLLSLAAALEKVAESGGETGYNKIIVSRSMADLDEGIGFLPGTEEEKVSPWLGSITDNLEFLACEEDASTAEKDVSIRYLERYIQYKSINYMRGRSIQKALFILDEVQNLTPHQVKTLVTRMGRGSKIILLGDLTQIDNPLISKYSSGLTYLIEKMSSDETLAHIELEGAPRSKLAERASELL